MAGVLVSDVVTQLLCHATTQRSHKKGDSRNERRGKGLSDHKKLAPQNKRLANDESKQETVPQVETRRGSNFVITIEQRTPVQEPAYGSVFQGTQKNVTRLLRNTDCLLAAKTCVECSAVRHLPLWPLLRGRQRHLEHLRHFECVV